MKTEFFTSRFLRSALCCTVFSSAATPWMVDAQSAAEPAATAASPATKADTAPATGYKEIKWDALVPKDWDPAKRFKSMNLGVLDANPLVQSSALQICLSKWPEVRVKPQVRQIVRIWTMYLAEMAGAASGELRLRAALDQDNCIELHLRLRQFDATQEHPTTAELSRSTAVCPSNKIVKVSGRNPTIGSDPAFPLAACS